MDQETVKRPGPPVIVLDIGNVILHFDLTLIGKRLGESAGVPWREIHDFVFTTKLDEDLDRGLLAPEALFSLLTERYRLAISFEEFSKMFCEIFTPVEGMESVVRGLRREHRLGILSNTNALHFGYIERNYPVMQCFNEYHLSYRLGLLKPDPAIYRKLIASYGRPAEDIVYVDDIAANVKSARRLGIRALQFESARQIKDDLRGLGVSWS